MTVTDAYHDSREKTERLSPENIARFVRGLPARAQMVLRGLIHMQAGSLTLTLPDGRAVMINGRTPGPAAEVRLHNWNLPQRALTGGTIAVAETYMDGDWDSPDVGAFLELFLVNAEVGRHFPNGARGMLRLIEKLRHWMNRNTKSGSRRNISAHYDLGNSFYSLWLDPSMTYSSALYATGATDLQSAQREKYKALAEAAGIGPGDHVLEIGCGWGGFAEYAAGEIGCKVTGLTISREQLAFAQARMEKAGLTDKVSLKFQDYRDETGVYDKIVSIEMFEAVGEKYWPAYFSQLSKCLKPGGRAGIQVITIKPESYREYRANPDFIQKYVFPGGMLPTREHLVDVAQGAGLSMVGDMGFGWDYARTLAEWRERFRAVWDQIEPLGFDTRFKRLWEFYLYYCEAGFRARNIDVRQVIYE
ncbi:cyclopropane-fatty-acyl-phospholipid synthase [Xaviernesmea oryzae]|uniref:Cyclopropane-fatty-acyl-phospholipid synthase n=1 Tax=Xaviernesmea oryzae TaxID=464029 RepID=A0A1Q9AWR6_9HYPH|nr:cyclopropane-fatty-acyl-phospholipid synthase family protein [Xaviernesmea oryzae]OLP59886.1 cyclopropane-fatty-acyl-phospholipid synthase [Xaviernesmea oryzae]SEK47179.1 cyclopropane-fatty-acyl-phospholipid synthase [Xaviernesmea oryzae]